MPARRRNRLQSSSTALTSYYDLLGEIPLLKSESRREFYGLRQVIEDELQPSNFFEFAEVHEISIKIWQLARLRRIQVGLIESPQALADFLAIVFDDNVEKAKNYALMYFSDDVADAEAASSELGNRKVSLAQIETYALSSQIQSFRLLDQIIQKLEFSNSALVARAQKRVESRLVRQANDRDETPSLVPGTAKVLRMRSS